MSRILRRPMFRGGPVDSRGTGITSGLMDGGRVGFDNGGSPFLRTPVSMSGGQITESQKSKPYLDINKFNYNAGLPFAFEKATPLNIDKKTYVPGVIDESQEEEVETTSIEDILKNKALEYGSQDSTKKTDVTIEDKIESYTPSSNEKLIELLSKDSTYTDSDGIERSTTTGEEIIVPSKTAPQDGFLPTPGPEKGSAPKKTITDNLLSTDSILNSQNTANEELTLEEIRDTLGYKKARSRDMGDMLARASASFLGTGGVREGLAEFMKSEAAAGPGRAEKIETAAATFMLQDKAQSKRDRANVELMKSKIDYQIEAGEDISLPKALLAANKSGMLNNKELSVGIQSATSPTTGKNFNFKKVVTLEEFKNIKDAQPGDTFVVKTKVKDPDTGSEKILKSIIEIDLDGTPQRIYNIA
jgi:hypothetical protein